MNNSAIDVGTHAHARHRRKIIRFALLAGIILPQLAWSATSSTWKWQDAEGNITYGDAPPHGVSAEQVSVRFGPSSTAPADSAHAAEDRAQTGATGTTSGTTSGTTEVAAAAGISPEQAATLCQQANTNLAVLNSNALIRQTDATGEERILDEQQKQAQIQTAREIIRYHCR